MSAKELVKAFYEADLANDPNVVAQFFHQDCELHWTSSQGFMILNYNDLISFFEGTRQSYNNLRFEFTHLIESDSTVVNRHTVFANTIENPDNEIILAHFTTIWEVKDNKLFRGFEISQQADEKNSKSLASYSERKI
ncbi:MAG: nuclear transport factor 2 family protein [Winogradskyella sp.]|uniref:nuclear transport factor 2 family protein n=1 Tax=Winogradskyella sp. TaxID=1883156 RepID=UPI0017B3D7AE|nr:nuclear transport factor 2 family protein [Winogradskyella sp.]